MPLREVRIDEVTWAAGSEQRRLEWTATIHEMLNPGEMVFLEPADILQVTMTQQHFQLDAKASSGEVIASVTLPHDRLGDLMTEYVDIVRQIATTDAITRLEALDMAKKATHDGAGRLIKRLCRALEIDHPTARRLFSLLLTLKVDTTRLVGVHGHRRVR